MKTLDPPEGSEAAWPADTVRGAGRRDPPGPLTWSTCPRCSKPYRVGDNYCGDCGKAVAWQCCYCKQRLPERNP